MKPGNPGVLNAHGLYIAIMQSSIKGVSGIDNLLQDSVNYSCCVHEYAINGSCSTEIYTCFY